MKIKINDMSPNAVYGERDNSFSLSRFDFLDGDKIWEITVQNDKNVQISRGEALGFLTLNIRPLKDKEYSFLIRKILSLPLVFRKS